jgi:hypothetical protein
VITGTVKGREGRVRLRLRGRRKQEREIEAVGVGDLERQDRRMSGRTRPGVKGDTMAHRPPFVVELAR